MARGDVMHMCLSAGKTTGWPQRHDSREVCGKFVVNPSFSFEPLQPEDEIVQAANLLTHSSTTVCPAQKLLVEVDKSSCAESAFVTWKQSKAATFTEVWLKCQA